MIKITYLCELSIVAEDDGSSESIVFHVPSHVTTAVNRRALLGADITQTAVDATTTDAKNLR